MLVASCATFLKTDRHTDAQSHRHIDTQIHSHTDTDTQTLPVFSADTITIHLVNVVTWLKEKKFVYMSAVQSIKAKILERVDSVTSDGVTSGDERLRWSFFSFFLFSYMVFKKQARCLTCSKISDVFNFFFKWNE